MHSINDDYKNNVIYLSTLSKDEQDKDNVISINIDSITSINQDNLQGDLEFLARNYSYFSRHLVIKEIKKEKFKQILNKKISQIYVEVKKQMTKGGKEPSDAKIRNEVEANKTLSDLKMKLIELEGDVKQLQSVCRSIDLKQRSIKDMIYLKIKHEELAFDNMKQGVKSMIDNRKYEKTKEERNGI